MMHVPPACCWLLVDVIATRLLTLSRSSCHFVMIRVPLVICRCIAARHSSARADADARPAGARRAWQRRLRSLGWPDAPAGAGVREGSRVPMTTQIAMSRADVSGAVQSVLDRPADDPGRCSGSSPRSPRPSDPARRDPTHKPAPAGSTIPAGASAFRRGGGQSARQLAAERGCGRGRGCRPRTGSSGRGSWDPSSRGMPGSASTGTGSRTAPLQFGELWKIAPIERFVLNRPYRMYDGARDPLGEDGPRVGTQEARGVVVDALSWRPSWSGSPSPTPSCRTRSTAG